MVGNLEVHYWLSLLHSEEYEMLEQELESYVSMLPEYNIEEAPDTELDLEQAIELAEGYYYDQ